MKDGISGATPSIRADVRYEKNLAKIPEAQAARTQEIKAKMAEWKRAATATPQATTAPTLQDLQAQFEQQEEAKFESGVVDEDEAREEERSLAPLVEEEQSLESDKVGADALIEQRKQADLTYDGAKTEAAQAFKENFHLMFAQ